MRVVIQDKLQITLVVREVDSHVVRGRAGVEDLELEIVVVVRAVWVGVDGQVRDADRAEDRPQVRSRTERVVGLQRVGRRDRHRGLNVEVVWRRGARIAVHLQVVRPCRAIVQADAFVVRNGRRGREEEEVVVAQHEFQIADGMLELNLDVVRRGTGVESLEPEEVDVVRAIGVGVDVEVRNADRALDPAQVRRRAKGVVGLQRVGWWQRLDVEIVRSRCFARSVHQHVVHACGLLEERNPLVVGQGRRGVHDVARLVAEDHVQIALSVRETGLHVVLAPALREDLEAEVVPIVCVIGISVDRQTRHVQRALDRGEVCGFGAAVVGLVGIGEHSTRALVGLWGTRHMIAEGSIRRPGRRGQRIARPDEPRHPLDVVVGTVLWRAIP